MCGNKLVVGILAHVDAGKTTLAEGLLYTCGRIRKLGRVDHKDAFLDNFSLERERGITIFSKQAQIQWEGLDITLLDTPGHVDFSAEMERTLQVLDYALLVISGSDGVQSHVQTLWRLLGQYKIPVFLFVNKMDQPGTDREKLLKELQTRLDGGCQAFGPEATCWRNTWKQGVWKNILWQRQSERGVCSPVISVRHCIWTVWRRCCGEFASMLYAPNIRRNLVPEFIKFPGILPAAA